MNKPPSREVEMPHVDPNVTDPQARRYAESVGQRRGGAPPIPRYAVPTAGGPTPSIPLLDSVPQLGKTMAEQARPQALPQPGGNIFGPPPAPVLPGGLPPPPPPIAVKGGLSILPMDMLPPQAMADPEFRQGMGAQYASSQPELARKYGVIRGEAFVPPQALIAQAPRPGTPGKLSPETIQGMQVVEALRKKEIEHNVAQQEEQAEQASTQSAAGIAAKAGAPNTPPQMTNEFDVERFLERETMDMLNNKGQRDIIEARLKPMDIAEMIVNGFVTQRVPIIPGKLEVEFQSVSGEEDLAIKRLVMTDANALAVTERYHLDKFSLMALAVGIFAINDKPLPTHKKENAFNDELFWVKFNSVIRYPMPMLAALGANYYWFDIRVRKLFVAEKVKNG